MSLRIRVVETSDAAMDRDVRPLMSVLRPDLTAAGFAGLVAAAPGEGLVFLAAYDHAGACVAVASYRVLTTSRGRILFVDDLVVEPRERGRGAGRALLAELRGRGRAADCHRLELDSGTSNEHAHRFYRHDGLTVQALHFAADLVAPTPS